MDERPEKYSIDAISLLNYCEGIAAGIEQDLYVEHIAKRHMRPVVPEMLKRYMYSSVAKGMDIKPGDYPSLVALYKRWEREA
ncbi:MAG TPA: hypothetical protein VKV96_03115 [Roseiarcus sp.]|nr:hypothetical protein [Roseiarcus sp.]